MPSTAHGSEWYARHHIAPRQGWVEDGVGYLPLTQGKVAMLDPAVLPFAQENNWTYSHGYAMRNDCGERVYLHYFVLSVADALVDNSEIDHKNGNPLDNRINNLRWVDRWQNQINRALQTNNTSGFRGVYRSRGKWAARLKRKGVTQHLGLFDTASDAATAYDRAAIEYGGGIIRLNFPR